MFVSSRATYKAMAAREDNIWLKLSAGNLEEVRAALQAGGDPNTRGGLDNKTCLMWAIIRGNEEMVDVLLEQPSIEVNAKDNDENTALHWACRCGRVSNVAILNQLLAAPGILVNERDSDGWTPIMLAIYSEAVRVMAVRVMAAVEEVDLDVSHNGRSLEDLAHRRAKYDVLCLLWLSM